MHIEHTNSGESLSFWAKTEAYQPLSAGLPERCFTCVIGAGIAGLSTAYELAKSGHSVVVLEMGPLFQGQSGRTTAHLSWVMDERFYHLIEMHGPARTRRISDSHARAIDRIERLIMTEKIDCDFKRLNGYLCSSPITSPDLLSRELKACHELGVLEPELTSHVSDSHFLSRPYLKFENQAQFHPLKYLNGLAQAIEKAGGVILTRHKVESIVTGRPCKVKLSDGRVLTCENVVVATNSPINDVVTIHTKQAAYRTYAITATIPPGIMAEGLYWDTETPYHYVRMAMDEKTGEHLLVVGGEDHKTGQEHHPEKHFENLEEWARGEFPFIKDVVDRWSGQVWEPADRIAFIGRNPGDENIYVVTGDSGQGMTYGVIAGTLIQDLILGRPNGLAAIYDPSRKAFAAKSTYLRENLNVAAQYADYFRGGEVVDESEIAPGEGAIMQQGIAKVAVYKNDHGQITQLSAVCTHLGGVVHWNTVEKSWDCPCHGSRFKCTGEVLTGPAVKNLSPKLEDSPETVPIFSLPI